MNDKKTPIIKQTQQGKTGSYFTRIIPLDYLLLAVPFFIFIFIFNFPAPPWPDQIVYDSVARDFLKSGLFRYLVWGDFDPTYLRVNFNNGPLYPFVHLVFLKIFGSTDPRLLVGFNYLLAFLTIINVAKILRLESRQKLLLVILAFNPLVYHYTNIARPEWLGLFILSCVWRVLARYDRSPPFWAYMVSGLLLALAALNHQFAIFFIPCVVYAVWRREGSMGKRLTALGIVTATTAVALSPYLYYIIHNLADFKLQLFGNQIGAGVKRGPMKFIKGFLAPLFYPLFSFFTQSGKIPRWQADLLPFSAIICFVALIIKFKNKIRLSPITVEAGFFWLFLNLGCSFSGYNPSVTVPVSIFAIALLKDLLPKISPRFVKGLAVTLLVAVTYQLWFYGQVSAKLFRFEDYRSAAECLAQKIPEGETVYVLAFPDPSVQLNNLREDLDVRRYIDFVKYTDAWKKIVSERRYFVVSEAGFILNRFDFGETLRKEWEGGQLAEQVCRFGNVGYRLWSRR